jgi:hypothetical protein
MYGTVLYTRFRGAKISQIPALKLSEVYLFERKKLTPPPPRGEMLAFWGKKEKEDERGDKGRNEKN